MDIRLSPSLLAWLRSFDAAARHGSFTKAAGRVFKTQSAVSMQMRRLEERVGKQLFVKDGRGNRLTLEGRSFNRVVVGGSREGTHWRANVTADELNGYVEVRQAGPNTAGSVFARLARLKLEPAVATEVEQLLSQPTSVPALDIAVDDLRWSGRSLGRVEVDAINRGMDHARGPQFHLRRQRQRQRRQPAARRPRRGHRPGSGPRPRPGRRGAPAGRRR